MRPQLRDSSLSHGSRNQQERPWRGARNGNQRGAHSTTKKCKEEEEEERRHGDRRGLRVRTPASSLPTTFKVPAPQQTTKLFNNYKYQQGYTTTSSLFSDCETKASIKY
jgi:hypothetical protein